MFLRWYLGLKSFNARYLRNIRDALHCMAIKEMYYNETLLDLRIIVETSEEVEGNGILEESSSLLEETES